MRPGGTKRARTCLEFLKKNLKLVLNSFIKIEPRLIRGGVGRIPEKTYPIAIPIHKSILVNFCSPSYAHGDIMHYMVVDPSMVMHPSFQSCQIEISVSKPMEPQ